jgi:hypothetical protein
MMARSSLAPYQVIREACDEGVGYPQYHLSPCLTKREKILIAHHIFRSKRILLFNLKNLNGINVRFMNIYYMHLNL